MDLLQDSLISLLKNVGIVTSRKLKYSSYSQATASRYAGDIYQMYRDLGGVLSGFPLRLRSWDMEFNGVAVELDEQLHFNRYRSITLGSHLYNNLTSFPFESYKLYSNKYEIDCLNSGGYMGKWTNRSCENQFGPASIPKNLKGHGAPRWKQRAFYDFVKDLNPLIIGIPVVRISIWDEIEDSLGRRQVLKVLLKPSISSAAQLKELILKRKPNL